MNARKQAHANLQHALDALGDGSGHDVWGPGPVGDKLWQHDSNAALAFDRAAQVIFGERFTRPQLDYEPFIPSAMRKLAPVILDIRLDALGVE